jgi:hypothetical protein
MRQARERRIRRRSTLTTILRERDDIYREEKRKKIIE